MGFPSDSVVKNLTVNARDGRYRFDPWAGKIPWSRKLQPFPVFLPVKFQEQRCLAGYSPWGLQESDTTEPLGTHTHSHTLTNTLTHLHTHTHTHTAYVSYGDIGT